MASLYREGTYVIHNDGTTDFPFPVDESTYREHPDRIDIIMTVDRPLQTPVQDILKADATSLFSDKAETTTYASAAEVVSFLRENTKQGGRDESISVKNSIEIDGGALQLVGDASSLSNNVYYGSANSGTKGFHPLPSGISYFKDTVIITTSSANFNSNTPVDIPDMSYVITQEGDYILYALINLNNDQNEEFEMYYAINGTPNLSEPVWRRFQKNQDDSVQGTWPVDGLQVGDIITIQGNTRGDNVDLENRKIIVQSWKSTV